MYGAFGIAFVPQQQQQQQQQQLFSVGAAGISGRPSPGPPSDSGSGITRSKAHQGAAAGGSVRKTVARAPVPPAGKSNKTPDADEDMEVMLMQGLQLKRPMGSAAPLPNSRPYGGYRCNHCISTPGEGRDGAGAEGGMEERKGRNRGWVGVRSSRCWRRLHLIDVMMDGYGHMGVGAVGRAWRGGQS